MNVVVLTPDRVGSTLLQRYITILMQGHDYGKPVVNLHELTNGLETYYNEEYGQTMAGKPKPRDENGERTWNYHQTIPEILEILKTTDHYKTTRMALYHLNNRADPSEHQAELYKYINDNFYIISAQRLNLFEHALSWVIKTHTKRFNVFSHHEKSGIFNPFVDKPVYIDPDIFTMYLDKYLKYETWLENFRIDSVFEYEKDIQDLDAYVNSLDIYPDTISFESVMGMDFKTWNTCHYLISDSSNLSNNIPALLGQDSAQLKLEPPKQVTQNAEKSFHKIGYLQDIENRIQRTDLSVQHKDFVAEHMGKYNEVFLQMHTMKRRRIMPSPLPIKLNTMMEKVGMISNFAELYKSYVTWSELKKQEHRMITPEQIQESVYNELDFWYNK